MWNLDDEADTTQKWQEEYAREASPNTSQTCTAGRSIGDKIFEIAPDIEWGDRPGFIDIKYGVDYTFYSGYKIWSSAADTTIELEKDGRPFVVNWGEGVVAGSFAAHVITVSTLTVATALL